MRELLVDTPDDVRIEMRRSGEEVGFVGGHNGYVRSHGLTHIRQIDLGHDGRGIAGEDTLATITAADEKRFDRAMDKLGLQGITFQVRFHLHPDVDAELDMGGAAVSMALKSGEIWVFRHDGPGEIGPRKLRLPRKRAIKTTRNQTSGSICRRNGLCDARPLDTR